MTGTGSVRLDMVTLLVPDYDSGIAFYCDGLGFDLIEDRKMSDTKRWVIIGSAHGMRLLIAKATTHAQQSAIGNLAGDRVGFFLHTDNFSASAARCTAGTVAVFRDPFGNRWDLIESVS